MEEKFKLLNFVLFIFTIYATPCLADDVHGHTTEQEIAKCWKISEKDRDSGVTTRMQAGSLATINCLKALLLKRLESEIDPNAFSAADSKKTVDELVRNLSKLQWAIHNERKSCEGMCGTMYQVAYLSPVSDMLEGLIRQFDELESASN